jgi:drug/metabolite transporter (DMT)-like permease
VTSDHGTRTIGVALALATALISGVAVFVNGYGVRRFDDATTYTTAKNAVAAILLAVLAAVLFRARASKSKAAWRPRSPLQWLGLFFVGVVGGSVPFVLFFEGLSRASSTQAAFIHKTLVIWVALLAVLLLRERLSLFHVGAIGLLVAGQAVLIGNLGSLSFGTGELMIFAATLLWAVEIVTVRKLLGSLASPPLAAARMGIGLVLLLAYLAISGRAGALINLSVEQWSWALLTGVILTGYVGTWYTALARAPAIDVSAVLVLGAVVTALLSRGFRGAALSETALVLIFAGAATVAWLAFRSRQPELAPLRP